MIMRIQRPEIAHEHSTQLYKCMSYVNKPYRIRKDPHTICEHDEKDHSAQRPAKEQDKHCESNDDIHDGGKDVEQN